ncbi:condensation domain-containing protein, partial [Streptomyces sp. ICBB 8177]|uniref:condensation domain-containing protein n=1 Tax=Streptomyces sp. ICBB 8177 TaxID=563922 RepID=UPI001F545BC1
MRETEDRLLPLTASQEGVWYGQAIDPDSPKYNIGECIEIHGPLDEELFERVVERVCDSCESLNTEFVSQGDAVYQRVARRLLPRAQRVDLSTQADPVATAERYMADDMATVDSVAAPRHTFALLRLGPELHWWYVRYHHIAIDGLSGSLFARRVAEAYTAAVRGEPEPEPLPPLGTLVDEELAYRASPAFERDRAYWTAKFADLADLAEGDGSHDGAFVPRRAPGGGSSEPHAAALHEAETLSPDVLDGLRRLAGESRTTWSAVLVSAVAAYLGRVTRSCEVTIGLASHGRHGAMLGVPGMTANILALRVRLTPGMTVRELVREVSGEMRSALRHRRYPREQLARDLGLGGGTARLCDLVVNVMPYEYDLDFAGSTGVSRLLSTGPVDDVSVFVSERAEERGPLIGFDASPDLYRAEDVLPHQHGITTMLAALAEAEPDLPVDRLPLTDATTTQRVLAMGRGAPLPVETANASLPELFAARAASRPDAVAVTSGDVVLSYAELDTLSAELATALTGHGLGIEDGVGVLVE